MSDNSYTFDIPPHHKSIIKVIGVGGGGSNAVNNMYNMGIRDVEFFVCNTDSQALQSSPVPNKLQIGTNLTAGLGAGANPDKGKDAALESKEEIREILSDGTKMVFVTAGMGGGTGTGAAPVIAKVAKELDILTVGIVTAPFLFEGRKKARVAEEGINMLKDSCDTVLVILNDKLREIYGNLSIRNAFGQADSILTTAAKGIAEIITVPGYVNVDFEDVKTVMCDAGSAVMGSAETDGENRARRAAEAALNSPLLNNMNIHGAQKILLSIMSGEQAELQMDELTEITDFIQEMAGEEADVIFGHGIDETLGESISVTVIATGFDRETTKLPTKKVEEKKVYDLDSSKQINASSEADQEGNMRERQQISRQPSLFEDSELFEDSDEPEASSNDQDTGSRTYYFERPRQQREDDFQDNSMSEHKVGLDDYEFIDKIEEEQNQQIKIESAEEKSMREIELKRDDLQKQARDRIEMIKKLNTNPYRQDDYKDKWNTPAYIRKNVNLQDVPHSSDHNVSRYNLNDDNQILGNNKFLHDNVD